MSGTLAPAQPTAAVDPAALNPGSYPTDPLPPLGNAGSDEAGRPAEGRRMANYVVGPWQAEPGMTDSRRTGAIVIGQEDHLGAILWPEVGGRSWPQPFVVAFSSERRGVDPRQPTVLRNAVLRYATPGAAAAAAQAMSSAAMASPTVVNSDSPVAAEPVRPVPIPGHADLNGALATRRDGDRTVQELTVISAHGPYVLVQVAQSTQNPDRAAVLAGRLLDLQAPLIDGFQPTDPGHLADIPLDPTGLVARTLPLKAGQGDSMSNAAYDPAGALHLEDNPIQVAQAFTDAGVDVVSTSQTTVYRARDPDGARRLAQSLGDGTAQRPASQPAPAVPGLPASRCVRIEEGGLVPRYWCIAAVDRFAFKAVAREENNAHQQMAAQYLILAG